MSELGMLGWTVTVVAVLLTGISKSGLGSALGGIAVPFMAMWISPRDAVAVMLPILMAMDLAGMRVWRGQEAWPDLKRLMPAALVGIAIGTLAFGVLSDNMVKAALGLIAVGFAIDRLVRLLRADSGMSGSRALARHWAWLSGAGAGFTSTLAHAGGPPLMIYLLSRNMPRRELVATSVFFFAVINAAKLPFYIGLGLFSRETLMMSAVLLPLVPVGVWMGKSVVAIIPERAFVLLATTLLALSGVKLLWDVFAA